MSTIINNPPGLAQDSSDNIGVVVLGTLLLVVLGILFVIYGLPMIQDTFTPEASTTNINVELPVAPTPTPVRQ